MNLNKCSRCGSELSHWDVERYPNGEKKIVRVYACGTVVVEDDVCESHQCTHRQLWEAQRQIGELKKMLIATGCWVED